MSWITQFAGRLSLAAVALAGTVAAVAEETTATPPPAAPADVPAKPAATPDEIREWIGQLGSEQFAQREAASRSLAAAGLPAIEPLGAAIRGEDFEVASRAMEVLRGFLEAEDEPLAAAAEKLAESIAEGPEGPVSSLAIAILDFHQLGMVEAAREKLESLGAIVTEGFVPSGSRGMIVVLNSSWRGTADDLRLLTRLRGVVQVGLRGMRIDEKAIGILGRLRGVESLQFYGTGVTEDALAQLAAKLPDAEIDFRMGGKLGVGGQPNIGPCQITQVQEGSAAAKAGLQIGDIVLKIDGDPVPNFESLTEKMGKRGPGEKVELEVERGFPGEKPERFTRIVELDGWE
ncbi:MAG: PDZ domain-containing protein [Planctomycetia bacterium]